LDLFPRQGLKAREQRLHLPLRRVIGQDELLRSGPVHDVRHPVIEIGSAAPGDGDTAHAEAPPTFHLGKWLSATAVHRAPYLQKAPVVVTEVLRGSEHLT